VPTAGRRPELQVGHPPAIQLPAEATAAQVQVAREYPKQPVRFDAGRFLSDNQRSTRVHSTTVPRGAP